MSADDFKNAKARLRSELQADLFAGRGRMPRDSSGEVFPSFLAGAADPERPRETLDERRAAATSLSELLAGVAIAPALEDLRTRVDRLEALERQLEKMLSTETPHLWTQLRGPLRRLLNRARKELRAIDRAALS